MKLRLSVLFCLIACGLWMRPACAGAEDQMRVSLRGLKGVTVKINGLEQAAVFFPNGSLREDQIKTDTELRLRLSHIPIQSDAVFRDSRNVGKLTVDVELVKSGDGGCVYHINVVLSQAVLILRDGEEASPVLKARNDRFWEAATWEHRTLGYGKPLPGGEVRRDIDDMLDAFCNDYLAANEAAKPSSATPTP